MSVFCFRIVAGHAAAILGGQFAEEGWMSQGIPWSDLKTCGWKLQLLQLKNLLKSHLEIDS